MLTEWQWSPQPEAGALVREKVGEICEQYGFAAAFAARLLREAGTRIEDLVDTLVLPEADVARAVSCGWGETSEGLFENRKGLFPKVVAGPEPAIFIKVESATNFFDAHGLKSTVESGRAQIEP